MQICWRCCWPSGINFSNASENRRFLCVEKICYAYFNHMQQDIKWGVPDLWSISCLFIRFLIFLFLFFPFSILRKHLCCKTTASNVQICMRRIQQATTSIHIATFDLARVAVGEWINGISIFHHFPNFLLSPYLQIWSKIDWIWGIEDSGKRILESHLSM